MKPTIKIFLLVSLALVIFLGLECKKKPTENDDDDKPGRRDYTWTIDTLSYPGSLQTTMYDMYAVNAKNIYVVGHNDQNRGHMYHYDGNTWKPVGLHTSEGGQISGAISIFAIYGFGANDIWAVGSRSFSNPTPPPIWYDSSLIIHFDGNQWSEVSIVRGKGTLQGIWGSSANDVWAGGVYGTLYHYNGIVWTKIDADTSLWFLTFGGKANEQYALAYNRKDTAGYLATIHYLLSYQETSWTIIDYFAELSYAQWTFGHYSIRYMENEFYSAGYGVFKKKNNSWNTLFDSGNNTFLDVFGTRKKNIFAVGIYGIVYHYNGTDWKKIQELYNVSLSYFSSGWTNEKEVFILASDNYKTYIYHGK